MHSATSSPAAGTDCTDCTDSTNCTERDHMRESVSALTKRHRWLWRARYLASMVVIDRVEEHHLSCRCCTSQRKTHNWQVCFKKIAQRVCLRLPRLCAPLEMKMAKTSLLLVSDLARRGAEILQRNKMTYHSFQRILIPGTECDMTCRPFLA